MRLDCLGKDRTHHEGTERTAEACFLCRQHHAEAQTQGEDDERLVIQVVFKFAYQCRDNQYSADEPCREGNGQIDNLAGQLGSLELMADGYAGEQYHQYHRYDILYDKDAGCSLDETLLTQAGLVDGLHHNRGARHAKHARQEQRVDHVKIGIHAHEIAKEHHAHNDGQCTYCSHLAATDEVLQAELQTDAEQDEQHTDVAPSLYVVRIHKGLAKQMRAYQDTCNDIAQHYRLL